MRGEHYTFAGASHAVRLQVNTQPAAVHLLRPGIGRGLACTHRHLSEIAWPDRQS